MLESREYEIFCREMIEDECGLFAASSPMLFRVQDSRETEAEEYLMPPQEAANGWVCWMRSQGYEVFELPRTTRTRDWGLTFSVTACGGESRVFVVTSEK